MSADPVVTVMAEALLGCDTNHPTYGTPEFASYQAEVVAAAVREAGFAIVQLPEGRAYPHEHLSSHGVSVKDGQVWDGNQPMTSLDAREFAAVLLAAAVVAEGEQ